MKRTNSTARHRWALALALLPLIAGACDSPTDTGGGVNHDARLSVYLRDAPGGVDSVWVQIDDIVMMGDSGSVSVLDAPTGLINVTALRDSASLLIDSHGIPAGSYQEVRFVLGGAVLQAGSDVYTFGGAEHPGGMTATGTLQCPSCAQSGIKVKLSEGLQVAEGENGLLLDFDVAQSFGHVAGHSGKWVMHPVVHGAEAEVGDVEGDKVGGRISGAVILGDDVNGNPVTVPACGGEDRSLDDFVPTAVASVLTDVDGLQLTFSGEVEEEDGAWSFGIHTLDFDLFTLGYEHETTFGTEKLVWDAEADPVAVTLTVDEPMVNGVTYTVTGVTCESVTP